MPGALRVSGQCRLRPWVPPPTSGSFTPPAGLVDENQKVKTITALTISALAEASGETPSTPPRGWAALSACASATAASLLRLFV